MNTLAIIFLFLICYWRIKNQFNQRITLEFQYKIYDVRDKLREYAISGRIDKRSWQFKYLDESLTMIHQEMDQMNLFTSTMLAIKLKDKSFFQNDRKRVVKGMKENRYTEILYDEYGKLIVHYLLRKAFFVRFSILVSFLTIFIGKEMLERRKRWAKRTLNNVVFIPDETQNLNLIC